MMGQNLKEKDKFQNLVDRYLEDYWESFPIEATLNGIHKYDHLLGETNREFYIQRIKKLKEFSQELIEKIDHSSLDHEDQLDQKLLNKLIEFSIIELEHLRFYQRNPSFYIPIEGISSLLLRDFASWEERLANVSKRLRGFPSYLEGAKRNLENPPKIWTLLAIENCKGAIYFLEHMISEFGTMIPELEKELSKAYQEGVSSLQSYKSFLEEKLAPTSFGDFALGQEWFNYYLKHWYMLDYPLEELEKIGEEMLLSTEEKMENLARRINHGKNWYQIVEEMKEKHPTKDNLKQVCWKEMEKAKEFIKEKNLVTIPLGEKIDVIDTPVLFRKTMSFGGYYPATPFNPDEAGFYMVTPVDPKLSPQEEEEFLRGYNIYWVRVVALHECYPGHHLQFSIAHRLPSKIRRIYRNDLLIEGWALYCEEMMNEQGFYPDLQTRISQLRMMLWRAARVVIDVGLHTKKMSFEDAVDFLVSRVKMERAHAEAEVKRYTLTPTQPLTYLIGMLEIRKIKEAYKQKVKGDFNLCEFHDNLLSFGALPLKLIAEKLLA